MQATWRLWRTMFLSAGLGLTVLSTLAVTNACDAQVTPASVKSKDGQARITFNIKTSCAASQGRFEYSYDSSERPGVLTVRKVPMWSASKGKVFPWTDEFRDGSTITNVMVKPNSIESKKL
jgi:hypothetical protein